jgi:hypothetical protein
VARVVQAFMENQLAVNAVQGSIVEAKLPREQGLLGSYDIVTRAVVLPADSGSAVTLYGEETEVGTGNDATHTSRLNPSNMGRALETWQKLVKIAETLQPDSTMRRIRTK